ncbi:MAG: AAA family ATPase [Chthoniobacter sp.]|nr:AAA family ATPase [Chthoniobacter sp.]
MKKMANTAVSTERLLSFLNDPRSYGRRSPRIRMLQTHASWVVLTPRFAYKVKKPVDFAFLDFSTLEKRRHFCEREVTLNRRLARQIYLGVVPISWKKNGLAFGIEGEIVEYAVKMRRLSARYFMLPLVKRGQVGTRDIDVIVAKLKAFYRDQLPSRDSARWGRVANLRISTDENFRQARTFIGRTISRPAFDTVRYYTERFYRSNAALFAARAREGRIRDCHGDLHLDHIHLNPKNIAIYDCIEFNDRFRLIDVANDVAFLAMDLDFHERPDLAGYFVARMARALADPGLLRVLDFYKCYRAFVRGKVEGLRHAAPGVTGLDRKRSQDLAERYFRLALRYAVGGSKPMVLIIMGRIASGKSTLASSLARELGWDSLSSDRVRKELARVPVHVRAGAAQRLRLYSGAMSDRTYAALTHHAIARIQSHQSVILDATFGDRRRREVLRKKLESDGINYCFVEARAAESVIRSRLGRRVHSADEVSDARLEDFPALNRGYRPPVEIDSQHFFTVKTAGTLAETVGTTLRTLASRRASRTD